MSAIASGGLPASLMLAIDRLSRELRADHREAAEQASDEALRQGLAEADALRERSDEAASASLVKAASLGLSGAAQLGAAGLLRVSPGAEPTERAVQELGAHNGKVEAFSRAATSLGQAGSAAGDVAGARAERHEADVREHAARAQAAGRKAEAEASGAQEARQSGERARELYQQMAALEHASRMAVLKG